MNRLEECWRILRRPPDPLPVLQAATVGDGIESWDSASLQNWAHRGGEAVTQGRVSWFIPASGAASRMFSSLRQETERNLFFRRLPELALARSLERHLKDKNLFLPQLLRQKKFDVLLHTLMSPAGLDMARRPKALVPFHWAGRQTVTAFEETLLESIYACDRMGKVRVHFTVPPAFIKEFRQVASLWTAGIRRSRGKRIMASFSVQDHRTDTPALEENGEPVLRPDGTPLLRPGGHGALLANLQATEGDVVLIKNIDNVPTEPFQKICSIYRYAMVGKLIDLQEKSRYHLARLKTGNAQARDQAADFIHRTLFRRRDLVDIRMATLRRILRRPWRVCAMVPNQGEPGGGPFWVDGPDGPSRQILESSQMTPHQKKYLRLSTHFNPVDMAVGLRSPEGAPLELDRFVDPRQVILSTKMYDHRPILTLEWPGLWNGSMAFWNTVFVEAPSTIFHPVKTVNDLFREGHKRSQEVRR